MSGPHTKPPAPGPSNGASRAGPDSEAHSAFPLSFLKSEHDVGVGTSNGVNVGPSTSANPPNPPLAEPDVETKPGSKKRASSSQNGDGADPAVKYKKRSRAPAPGTCQACNSADTPEWRRGPGGARTLCNACGLHWAKLNRKREQSRQQDGTYLIPPITLEDLRAAPIKRSVYDEVPLHGSTTAAAAAAAAAAAVAAAASVPHPPITSALPHSSNDNLMAGLGAAGLSHLATGLPATTGGLAGTYGRNGVPTPSYFSNFAGARIGNPFTSLSGGPQPPPPPPAGSAAAGPSHSASSTAASSRISPASSGPVSAASPTAAAAAAAVVALQQNPFPLSTERRYNFSNDREQPLPAPAPTSTSSGAGVMTSTGANSSGSGTSNNSARKEPSESDRK